MKVTVLGPNGINDASFHVHKAGCADIKKPKYRWALSDGTWGFDASSKQEIVEVLWSDFIGTGETLHDDGTPTSWLDYQHDTRIFPCVGLKEEAA